MKKLISILLILISILTIGSTCFAQESIINQEDIKTIQNDQVVPRKTLFQSMDAIRSVNKSQSFTDLFFTFDKSKNNITDPFVAMRNFSLAILVLFLIMQIISTIIGKTSLKDLFFGTLSGIMMQTIVALGIFTIINTTDLISSFFASLSTDFITFNLQNMMSFVATPSQGLSVINANTIGKINSVDFNTVNLSMEGFCLTTIQDQYRMVSLVLSWLYVLLVYANWLILLLADFTLKICMVLSPLVGISYVFGARLEIIQRYWTILLKAAGTKLLFYLVLVVVSTITTSLKPNLIRSGVNIEFALFCCTMLIALGLSVLGLRRILKVDSGVTSIVNSINKLNKQI